MSCTRPWNRLSGAIRVCYIPCQCIDRGIDCLVQYPIVLQSLGRNVPLQSIECVAISASKPKREGGINNEMVPLRGGARS